MSYSITIPSAAASISRLTAPFRLLTCVLALATFLTAPLVQAASEPVPSAVVQEFYAAHFKDFDSAAPALRRKEKWLSKGLIGSIHAWQRRSAKNVPKGDIGDIEGDLFTDAQDEPTSFKVGAGTVNGVRAEVPITFRFDKEVRKGTVNLQLEEGAWKIDNLVINGDNLRKLLDSADQKK